MKRFAKTDFADSTTAANTAPEPGKRVTKRAKKHLSTRRKRPGKMPDGGFGIRETEETRALLEDQLHSLYWWVFNAFKMKGFIRAKALDELQQGSANGEEPRIEQRDFAEADVPLEK
jgi:hypothetical protein